MLESEIIHKETIMKKLYLLFLLLPTSTFANNFTLTYYDNNWYDESDGYGPEHVPAGKTAFVSDIYYYFKPFDKTLQTSQTEWLSDGHGEIYIAPDSPATFDYHDITFDNIASECFYLGEDYNFMNNILPAWKNQYAKYIATTQINIPKIQNTNNVIRTQNRQILNSVFNHKNIKTGRNGGDIKTPLYVWGQTLYSHDNKRGENAFSSDTMGIIFGSEIELSQNINIGIGYSYADSSVNNENLSINNNAYFIYGDYTTTSWFINAVATYNSGKYKNSVYDHTGDTNAYFAALTFGINTEHGFSPEIGLRYNTINTKDHDIYETTIKNNTWTGTIGTKYKYNINRFTLGGKILIDYDINKSNDNISVFVLDQTIHLSKQNKYKPLGTELGIWANYNVSNIDLRLEYDLFIQSDYTNHTGRLSFNYGF